LDVYNYPAFYELAFSHRDIPGEVDFLEEVIRRYSRIPVRTILELASGNSPHLEEICRRGYDYLGVEVNPNMVEFSRDKIRRCGLAARVVQSTMVDFRTPETADFAAVFLCSFYVNDSQFETHFDSVARAVRPGGLYVLDGVVSHFPEDLGLEEWDEERDGVRVHVGYDTQWEDESAHILRGTLTLDFEKDGQPQRVQHTELRIMHPAADFIERVERTGKWNYVGAFSDFDINCKPHADGRSIMVLRRE